MNRDFDVDQSLERLSAFDRQYVGQLNDVAAVDDLDALDAPFHDLDEQECLALVAGVEAQLAALEATHLEPTHLEQKNRGGPQRTQRRARAAATQRLTLGATGVAFAAGLMLLFSDVLTPRSEVNLPDYVIHPPRADSTHRGTQASNVADGALPIYTIGRTLEFVLQPSQRSEAKPRVWAFEARDPRLPLRGLEATLGDGGGLVITLPTSNHGFEPRPGPTELVFLIGPEAASAPSLEMVNGITSPPVGFKRLTFPLRWASVDSPALQ
jgi:hypothetical protein